jgi:hypothetical protein
MGFYEGIDYFALVLALFYLIVEIVENVGLVWKRFVKIELKSLK